MRRLSVVLVLLAMVLGACGGGGMSNAERVQLITKASTKTLASHTAGMSTATKSSAGGPSNSGLDITSTGVFDFDKKAGIFNIEMAGLGAGGNTAEFRLVGRTVYFKAPAGLIQGGKAWLKVDLNDPALAAAGLGGLEQISNADPSTALSFLKGIVGEVKDEGTEKVRGTETTHYSAVIDTAKAAASADANSKPLLQQSVEKGIKRVPTDLWIDGDGRLRRVRQLVDLSKSTDATARASGTITTTVEFFDFGTSVNVVAPADDETMSFAELQQLLAKSQPQPQQ